MVKLLAALDSVGLESFCLLTLIRERATMKVLSWNCNGLGNEPAIRALLDVQRKSNPDVMFLSETHLESYPAECLRRRLKMDQKFVCHGDGRKGGLILFWKKEFKVQRLDQKFKVQRLDLDPMFIYVLMTDTSDNTWILPDMYGEFKNKHKTWDRMRALHQSQCQPWFLAGDLNEIQFLQKKKEVILAPINI